MFPFPLDKREANDSRQPGSFSSTSVLQKLPKHPAIERSHIHWCKHVCSHQICFCVDVIGCISETFWSLESKVCSFNAAAAGSGSGGSLWLRRGPVVPASLLTVVFLCFWSVSSSHPIFYYLRSPGQWSQRPADICALSGDILTLKSLTGGLHWSTTRSGSARGFCLLEAVFSHHCCQNVCFGGNVVNKRIKEYYLDLHLVLHELRDGGVTSPWQKLQNSTLSLHQVQSEILYCVIRIWHLWIGCGEIYVVFDFSRHKAELFCHLLVTRGTAAVFTDKSQELSLNRWEK